MEDDVATRILANALLRPLLSWHDRRSKRKQEVKTLNLRDGAADEWGRVRNKAPPTTDN